MRGSQDFNDQLNIGAMRSLIDHFRSLANCGRLQLLSCPMKNKDHSVTTATTIKDKLGQLKIKNAIRFNDKCMLGDQDWLTLLSWQHPRLFHHLPCNFNFQEPHPSFPRDQDPKWDPYFHCEGEVLVLHRPWTLDSDFLLPD